MVTNTTSLTVISYTFIGQPGSIVCELAKSHKTILLDPKQGMDNVGLHLRVFSMFKFKNQIKDIIILQSQELEIMSNYYEILNMK